MQFPDYFIDFEGLAPGIGGYLHRLGQRRQGRLHEGLASQAGQAGDFHPSFPRT
jgi:hypothetical protein